jgi:hypothetical protein
MSIEVTPLAVAPVFPVQDTSSPSTQSTTKTPPPPPPPPPTPPPKDTVEISLAATIKVLKSQGDSIVEISQRLGVPVQTVSVDLGSALIEASLASAPTLPVSLTGN